MNDNLNKEVITLPPFKRLCMSIGELPSSYLESMTYYESLLWFTRYLKDTVIPTINNNAEAVEELQTKYIELKDYVDNYFENLDIQEEINNKLDEMAESGELADIIAQYLQVASVLGFDTKAALKAAENLAEGSITKTLGTNTYNDGKGNFYKIRTLTSGDVIDDDNILALANYPTLIAEKMPDYRMNQAENAINTIENTTIPSINQSITDLETSIYNKKYLLVGDSYAEGYTPDGNVTGWPEIVKQCLSLTNDQCVIAYHGGAGFTPDNNTFYDIINNLTSDEEISDVVICGGYNDTSASGESILQGMTSTKNLINTKFPNAKIHVGFIGFTNTNSRYSLNNTRNNYVENSAKIGLHYLNNVEYSLRLTYNCFSSDNFHPNQNGQNKLGRNIAEALISGSVTVIHGFTNLNLEVSGSFDTLSGGFINNIGTIGANNLINLSMANIGQIKSTNGISINCNGSSYEFANITRGYLTGNEYNTCCVPVDCVIESTDSGYKKYYSVPGTITIENKKLYIRFFDTNNDNSNYRSFNTVKNIQVMRFNGNFDAMFC